MNKLLHSPRKQGKLFMSQNEALKGLCISYDQLRPSYAMNAESLLKAMDGESMKVQILTITGAIYDGICYRNWPKIDDGFESKEAKKLIKNRKIGLNGSVVHIIESIVRINNNTVSAKLSCEHEVRLHHGSDRLSFKVGDSVRCRVCELSKKQFKGTDNE